MTILTWDVIRLKATNAIVAMDIAVIPLAARAHAITKSKITSQKYPANDMTVNRTSQRGKNSAIIDYTHDYHYCSLPKIKENLCKFFFRSLKLLHFFETKI